MKSKRRIIPYTAAFLVCITALGILIVRGFRDVYTARTAADAKPEDVTFLRLPSTASHIGFWRDGLNYWAEFDIPEQDFRQLFSKYQLHEVTDSLEVRPKKFGDHKTFPPHTPATPVEVSSGLHYQERWNNGGGYDIIYDRVRARANAFREIMVKER